MLKLGGGSETGTEVVEITKTTRADHHMKSRGVPSI